MNRNFNTFTDFESLELEVPTFCVVTGCVSARRDRRYSITITKFASKTDNLKEQLQLVIEFAKKEGKRRRRHYLP
jgi:hypothetical protein